MKPRSNENTSTQILVLITFLPYRKQRVLVVTLMVEPGQYKISLEYLAMEKKKKRTAQIDGYRSKGNRSLIELLIVVKKKESYVFHPMLRMSIPIIEKHLI